MDQMEYKVTNCPGKDKYEKCLGVIKQIETKEKAPTKKQFCKECDEMYKNKDLRLSRLYIFEAINATTFPGSLKNDLCKLVTNFMSQKDW